jgi:hypothetical protein
MARTLITRRGSALPFTVPIDARSVAADGDRDGSLDERAGAMARPGQNPQ